MKHKQKTSSKIIRWIKDTIKRSGAKGCIFAMSGGIDSSTVAVLCKKALPDHSLGLIMPCYSNQNDKADALKVAEKFSIKTKVIDLKSVYDQNYRQLEGKPYNGKAMNMALANLKSRLRMVNQYYYANKLNYLVVGTVNKCELIMGYSAKYGNSGVDILPLSVFLKSQVKDLARELDIPETIINKTSSTGLWPNQTHEGEWGITYEELEEVILAIEKGKTKGLNPKTVKFVVQKMNQAGHKHCLPFSFTP